MPRSRVELDPAAFARLERAVALGAGDIGAEVVRRARVPDAPPIGQGLVETGASAAFLGGRRIEGTADAPSDFDAPDGPAAIAGFDFPARFQEEGTIRQPARPFLSPAAEDVSGDAGAIMARRIGSELR